MMRLSGDTASRPAASKANGIRYYDTQRGQVYLSTGGSWVPNNQLDDDSIVEQMSGPTIDDRPDPNTCIGWVWIDESNGNQYEAFPDAWALIGAYEVGISSLPRTVVFNVGLATLQSGGASTDVFVDIPNSNLPANCVLIYAEALTIEPLAAPSLADATVEFWTVDTTPVQFGGPMLTTILGNIGAFNEPDMTSVATIAQQNVPTRLTWKDQSITTTRIRLMLTGANAEDLTAGRVKVWVTYLVMPS